MANPTDILGGHVELSEARRPTDVRISMEADPPIKDKETQDAPIAVCPWHGGLVKRFPNTAKHGAVYFCPPGQQFWRYAAPGEKNRTRFGKRAQWPPINYGKSGVV